ncbi:peptidoglycan-binding protein [Halobacillus litoralis]|uniref:peptidoglycan-binding protein n=1 Tax=Halobacillus litoralis TaxID=45668 RepID=UPI001CFCD1DE|nr:peptidoglycan-binding protein [Halobacillus litoralis]WLR48984.1 peptidoglycan-binding protein [Halobacillus litoralis]
MMTLETLKQRSLNKMGNVQKIVKEKVWEMIEQAYSDGILVQISSGHRTYEEQAHLYGQGRPDYYWQGKRYGHSGNIVTYAKPGKSNHHSGRAVDFFLVSSDGKKALWTVDQDWRHVADIAKSLGFQWGGDWSSFNDYAHLEWPEKSNDVRDLQTKLQKLGYEPGPMDGIYGPRTKKAVVAFQHQEGLEVDGSAGPITTNRLNARTYPGYPIHFGAEGSVVKRIQRAVGTTDDGHFGPLTEAAVCDFQQQHRLEIDGVVGPITWRKIFGNQHPS